MSSPIMVVVMVMVTADFPRARVVSLFMVGWMTSGYQFPFLPSPLPTLFFCLLHFTRYPWPESDPPQNALQVGPSFEREQVMHICVYSASIFEAYEQPVHAGV